jgi:type I restriction enzyme, S subunit
MKKIENIPDGWGLEKLEAFCDLQAGKFIPASSILEFDTGDLYPCYGGNGMRGYTKEFSHNGTFPLIGRQGALCGNINKATGAFYATEHAVVATPCSDVDVNWLYYQLIFSDLNRYATGAAQPGLSVTNINKIQALLPPLGEQKAIAGVLGTWDEVIEKTSELIALKEKKFKWLLKSLISDQCSKNNEKSDWKKVKLGDVATMKSGGTPKSSVPEYYNGSIPWVSISDMTNNGMYIRNTVRTLSKQGVKNSSACVFPPETVLYAMYASIGEVSIAKYEMATSQAILGIQVGELLYNKYLYYYLRFMKEKIKLQGQSGTQSNLNAKMVKLFKLSIPPIEQQKQIASTLNAAQEEIDLLKKLVEKYKDQKKGLMQKLLTGSWLLRADVVQAFGE